MAVLISLAKERAFRGNFTQRKILWAAIEELEGKTPTPGLDAIETLLIQTPTGKIESNTGSGFRYATMTYAHLCTIMRDQTQITLHDPVTFESRYALWQSEVNQIYRKNEETPKEENQSDSSINEGE